MISVKVVKNSVATADDSPFQVYSQTDEHTTQSNNALLLISCLEIQTLYSSEDWIFLIDDL